MSTSQLTEGQRAERRRAERERLERAARRLLDSEGWETWVRARARNGLARYSFHNQLLIAMQRPDATYVAGFRAFLALNRCVCKGEKAIRILAPMSVRTASEDSERESSEGSPERRTVFRAVAVFDVSQTRPLPGVEPVPLEPPAEPILGDSHEHLLVPLTALAAELGYTVQTLALEGPAGGFCDKTRRQIALDATLPANARVRVLVHEIAHALGVGYEQYGRSRAEVIVDTVTFVVCGSIGLDTTGSSVPYVAGWGEDGALDAIRSYAQTIDTIARRIEAAFEDARAERAAPTS